MQLIAALTAALALATTAAAGPIESRQAKTILPTTTSQYNVWTGAISKGTAYGKVFKNGRQADITTLVTFDFPASIPKGSMCTLGFYLDAGATLSGSQRAQIFTSLKPVAASTSSWPPGNLRDQHIGDFKFVKPGNAVVEATYGGKNPFPCPIGQTIAGEVVGRWDEVHVEWDVTKAGPRITWV
jgi:hypothetical protein